MWLHWVFKLKKKRRGIFFTWQEAEQNSAGLILIRIIDIKFQCTDIQINPQEQTKLFPWHAHKLIKKPLAAPALPLEDTSSAAVEMQINPSRHHSCTNCHFIFTLAHRLWWKENKTEDKSLFCIPLLSLPRFPVPPEQGELKNLLEFTWVWSICQARGKQGWCVDVFAFWKYFHHLCQSFPFYVFLEKGLFHFLFPFG